VLSQKLYNAFKQYLWAIPRYMTPALKTCDVSK
jgi:hypothetical protein